MGPLWCGQGTVPHTRISDLLSTNVVESPTGAVVGAAWGIEHIQYSSFEFILVCYNIPANIVLVLAVTVLLVLLPNTAVTLTAQWLPGSAGIM